MIGLLLPLALAAAPPIDAPDVLPIDLPPQGYFRVPLSPDVTALALGGPALADPYSIVGLAGDRLALRDAAGQPVPFVTISTEVAAESWSALDIFPVDTHVWRVGPTDLAVDQLRLDFADDLSHPLDVTVDGVGTVRFARGTVGGEEVTVQTVTVPPGHGPWIVRAAADLSGATGFTHGGGLLPPTCEELPAGDPTLTEENRARYVVTLPGARWIRTVDVHSAEPVFRREVFLRSGGSEPGYSDISGVIRAVELWGARLREERVAAPDLHTDQLVVEVTTDRGRVLPLTGFTVCSIAAELLVQDPGPGPLQLYVGGQGDTPSTDLRSATAEVRSSASLHEVTAALAPNPAFVPLEEREGVDQLAAPLPVVKWRWQRPILGSGWVRIPLDTEVLARASAGQGDVRIVAADDRQVPFVLRRTGAERAWPAAPFTREEVGSASFLRVPLGQDEAPVASVTLTTERGQFTRRVTVLRDRGTVTEELRSVEWNGSDTRTLNLSLDTVVGKELLLRIDNGDNPPLALVDIQVTYPEVELRAHVPEGARLLYGSRTAEPPTYDLGRLADTLARRRLPEATLGPAEETRAPALGAFARIAVIAGITTLAAALFVMLGRLLFATRVPDEPAPASPPPGEAPPTS